MPKPGFKSIIVSENIYKKFFSVYEKRKNDLELKWIKSFSGYLTSMMEEMMLNHEAFAKQAPFMEKISIDSDRVLIKDNKRKRIAEVILRKGNYAVLLDEKIDCIHIGFVYSLPKVYIVLNNKRIKAPKSLY